MRKAIFLLLAGTILAVPFVAWADVGGSASAKLTLSAVIAVSITDQWEDLTIIQEGMGQNAIAGWSAGTVIDWDTGNDDIVVLIKAITDFVLYGCYYAKEGTNNVDPPFGAPNDLLFLNYGGTDYALLYNEITNPESYSGDYSGLTTLYTFSGNNNIGSGGTELKYEVKLKPESLGDRESNEEITFTIVFVVEEKNL
jgi:hypothetical protein